MSKRNEHKVALFHRAGTAHVAVAVDSRLKIVRPRKGCGSYSRKGTKLSPSMTRYITNRECD